MQTTFESNFPEKMEAETQAPAQSENGEQFGFTPAVEESEAEPAKKVSDSPAVRIIKEKLMPYYVDTQSCNYDPLLVQWLCLTITKSRNCLIFYKIV